MDRQIVCFAIPSLEIALVRLSHPQLRTRPLAVAALDTPRARLREISPEAERDGLHIGMTLDRARRLCPSLHVRLPTSQVATATHSILGVIQRYAPTWEPFLPGSLLMDLTGTTRLFGSACDVAAKIQTEVLTQCHLEGVAGVGSNKLVAQTAAPWWPPPNSTMSARDRNASLCLRCRFEPCPACIAPACARC
jgi:DNA polymerase-4